MTNWLTIEGAAKHLKMGRSTLYKLAQAKKMPAHKVGNAWRFDTAELDEWLKSGAAALGAEPPRLKNIKAILQERREQLLNDYGVSNIGVFGSCVREEATAKSDVDILVEFNQPVGFFKFMELEEQLSKWLGVGVDLVSRAALKPRIGRRILAEVSML